MTQTLLAPGVTALETEAPSAPAGEPVRLHPFQTLMRCWTELGPYNAGQVLRVQGAADLQRWRRAVEATLHETRLGRPEFSGSQVRFAPVASISIEQPSDDFAAYVNRELNRPFAGNALPFRFFALDAADGSHLFGAFYDHWIADSRAMRDLLQRIFRRYQHPEAPADLPPLTLQAPPYTTLFRRYIGPLPRTMAIRESLRSLWRHLRCHRVNLRDPLDFSSGFLHVPLPEGLIGRIHQLAKASGASVNDAFLAAMAQTLGTHTAQERYRKRRRRRDRIGLGTIVDIRDAAGPALKNVFGVYLSSYTVVVQQPEQSAFPGLLKTIAEQTQAVKRTHRTIRALAEWSMAGLWWKLYRKPRHKALLFQKNVPLAGGISNVNLTGAWMDQAREAAAPDTPQVLDYLRISPTGPLLPLVFTLTTLGSRLSLCVTYRRTAFTEEQAIALTQDFIQRLQQAVQENPG